METKSKNKLNLYLGTKKPTEEQLKSMNPKDMEEYQKNPWFIFFCENNTKAIKEAKKHNLKDLAIVKPVWSE